MSFVSCRRSAGISQAKAAENLGVSVASVCMWETGKMMPRAEKLVAIARIYGCTIEQLLSDNPAADSE